MTRVWKCSSCAPSGNIEEQVKRQSANRKRQNAGNRALSPLGERVAHSRRFHQSVSRRSRVRGSSVCVPRPCGKTTQKAKRKTQNAMRLSARITVRGCPPQDPGSDGQILRPVRMRTPDPGNDSSFRGKFRKSHPLDSGWHAHSRPPAYGSPCG